MPLVPLRLPHPPRSPSHPDAPSLVSRICRHADAAVVVGKDRIFEVAARYAIKGGLLQHFSLYFLFSPFVPISLALDPSFFLGQPPPCRHHPSSLSLATHVVRRRSCRRISRAAAIKIQLMSESSTKRMQIQWCVSDLLWEAITIISLDQFFAKQCLLILAQ